MSERDTNAVAAARAITASEAPMPFTPVLGALVGLDLVVVVLEAGFAFVVVVFSVAAVVVVVVVTSSPLTSTVVVVVVAVL